MKHHKDKSITKMKHQVLEALEFTISQYKDTYKAIKDNNYKLAKDVYKDYKIIFNMYYNFFETSIWQMTKQQLISTDLKKTVSYIGIFREIRRTSEYASKICKFISKYKPTSSTIEFIEEFAKKIIKMLNTCIEIFDNEELQGSKKLIKLDIKIKKTYDEKQKILLEKIRTTQDINKINIYVKAMSQLKYLYRASDHIIQIAEFVMYMQEGQLFNIHEYFGTKN